MYRFALLLGLLIAPLGLSAAEPDTPTKPKFEELPEPPPLPKNYRGDPPPPASAPAPAADELEPEITITTRGGDRYEEYRIRGQLYMIKVTPAKGAPYYLVDQEGRGQFSRSELAPRESIPMWVIKHF